MSAKLKKKKGVMKLKKKPFSSETTEPNSTTLC
jgi:hypothetical protein